MIDLGFLDRSLKKYEARVLACSELKGQASARRYFRLSLGGKGSRIPSNCIMVLLGEDPLTSDEKEGAAKGPAELPFSSMQRFLAKCQLPVPQIYVDEWRRGYQLMTDLGDLTLKAYLERQDDGNPIMDKLRRGIDLLLQFQKATWTADKSEACPAFGKKFDLAMIEWELEHFREWAMDDYFEQSLTEEQAANYVSGMSRLAGELDSYPRRLAHRDFQSTNIMVMDGVYYLIDFQDAFMACEAYDLVAYLRDSYVVLSREQHGALLDYYIEQRARFQPVCPDFRRLYALATIQRKLKDAGRFVYIDRVRGKPEYLQYIDATMTYVKEAFELVDDYSPLADCLPFDCRMP